MSGVIASFGAAAPASIMRTSTLPSFDDGSSGTVGRAVLASCAGRGVTGAGAGATGTGVRQLSEIETKAIRERTRRRIGGDVDTTRRR